MCQTFFFVLLEGLFIQPTSHRNYREKKNGFRELDFSWQDLW